MENTGAMSHFKRYSQYIKPDYFRNPSGIHGVGHAQRMLFLAELLGNIENLDDGQRDTLCIAAVYHDIGRIHDGAEHDHGYSSFNKVEKLNLIQNKNYEYYYTVKYLIETHCINDNNAFALVTDYALQEPGRAKSLLKFFKDADGLDRVRIHDLNPSMLRLPVSQKFVQLAEELYMKSKSGTFFNAL
jgi:hypothetical protein